MEAFCLQLVNYLWNECDVDAGMVGCGLHESVDQEILKVNHKRPGHTTLNLGFHGLPKTLLSQLCHGDKTPIKCSRARGNQ